MEERPKSSMFQNIEAPVIKRPLTPAPPRIHFLMRILNEFLSNKIILNLRTSLGRKVGP